MKTSTHIIICISFVAVLAIAQSRAIAQNTQQISTAGSPLAQPAKVVNTALEGNVVQRKNHVGIGVSYATGDAAFGRPEPMISALYSRSFTKDYGLELALHYLAGRIFNSGLTLNGVGTFAVRTSWTADATFMLHGQDGILKNFSVGAGPSIRNLTGILTGLVTLLDGTENTHIAAKYENLVALGGNVKLEYQLPIDEQVECALRLQYHQFASPFIGYYLTTSWSSASLGVGAFFRVRF